MFLPNFGVKIDDATNSLKSNKITTPTSILKSSPVLPYSPLRDQGVLWVQDTSLKFTNGLGITNTISSDTGGVTEIDTGAGLTGGPITSSGTISISSRGVSNGMLENDTILVTTTNGIAGGGLIHLGGELLLYLNQIEPVESKTIYISIGGSDVTGDGTVLNPYGTIQHALTIISPTPSNRYLLIICPGTYPGNITLKSNVSLFAYPTQNTILSGNITISDASWSGSGNNTSSLSNISIAGTGVFNFQSISSSNSGLTFDNVIFSSVLSVIGLQNNSVLVKNSNLLSGATISGANASVLDSNSTGNVSFNSNDQSSTQFDVIGGSIIGDLNCNGLLGTQNVNGTLENCLVSGRIFVTGSNASMTCGSDSLNILPSVTNSGVLTITNYSNLGLNVDPTTTSSGGGLTGAYVLKNYFTRITTNASGNGVRLPSGVVVGSVFCVRNDSDNDLFVYPNSLSSQINSLAPGSPFALSPSQATSFINYSSGLWCTTQ